MLSARGQAAQRLKRHAEAIADFSALIPRYPRAANLYRWRAQSLDALGKPDEAKADRAKALEFTPDEPRQLNEQAWRMVAGPPESRDAKRALPLIERAVLLRPGEHMYLNTLGVAQYRNGLHKEAIATLEKSLSLGKGVVDAHDLYFLAMCHAKLGDAGKAKQAFDLAINWHDERGKSMPAEHQQELAEFRAEAEEALRTAPPKGAN